MKRSFIREILESIDSTTISFAGGLPDESCFPKKKLRKASNKVLKENTTFQYGQSNGIYELRNQIAKFYTKKGFKTKADNILITSGSQQALYILANYFSTQNIIIESPSYLGAVNVFKANSLKMKTIQLHNNGIDIKKFTKIYKNTKLAYLIPDFQNPKGSLYSNKKRGKIAKNIQKYGGYIIEDAPYSELFFKKELQSISSMVPKNSFHLGSFSKTLSPALRIGWIRADKKLIENLIIIKESIDLHSCGISQAILIEFLKDTKVYAKHLDKLRTTYKKKMNFFSKILKKEIPNIEFIKPKGGMFIYVKLQGIDTKKLFQKTIKEKIVFVPGSEFYIENTQSNEIRFSFTNATRKEIKEGIKRLKFIINNNYK